MGIMITIKTILAICGAISIIGSASFVLYRWCNTAIKFKNRVDILEVANKELTEKLEELTVNTQCLLKCTIAILNSTINGDDIENLKEAQKQLNEFLIHK